jgi:peroxiredoxin
VTASGPSAILDRQQAEAEAEWLAAFLTGPKRTRWSSLPPQVGDLAPDVHLPDTTGAVRPLSSFWADQPLHLIFFRHFGCSCLSARLDPLAEAMPVIEGRGARVVGVTQAEPERTAAVAQRRGYAISLLADPERTAFEAFGLLEGTPPTILHDFTWRPGDRETVETAFAPRRGTERAGVDNPWQLPGDFVIGTDGRIVLAHRYQYCEDHPPTGVILGAVDAALSHGRVA